MKLKKVKESAIKLKQGFKVSHLICLSIGVLIPIYADVLFLHEFNSSTVSAIMDTVMATAAVSAALSVRGWLKDKMKNKGFEQTHKIISDLYIILGEYTLLGFSCDNFAEKYFNGMDLGISNETIIKDAQIISDLSESTNNKVINSIIELNSLPMWDINCIAEDKITYYLDRVGHVCDVVDSVLRLVNLQTFSERKEAWLIKKPELEKMSKQADD